MDRTQAIEEFTESVNLDRRIMAAVSQIIARSPTAVLIAWEEGGALHATSVPFSPSLIKGMTDTLFDAVFGDKVEQADSDDADSDD